MIQKGQLNCITDVIRVVGMSEHKNREHLAGDVFAVAQMLGIKTMHFDNPNHPNQTPINVDNIRAHIDHCFNHIIKGNQPERWKGFILNESDKKIILNYTI